jgi:hypothetical protein
VSGQLPGGGIKLSPAEIEALDARWSSCLTPGEVARYLAGIAAPWCVAAGWGARGGEVVRACAGEMPFMAIYDPAVNV